MLPTQELFRAIPCPYYVSGLCERPHCFFRHTKSDVALARKSEKSFLDEGSAFSDDDDDDEDTGQESSTSSGNAKLSLIQRTDSSSIPTGLLKSARDELNEESRKRAAEGTVENLAKKTRLMSIEPESAILAQNTEKDASKTPKVEEAISLLATRKNEEDSEVPDTVLSSSSNKECLVQKYSNKLSTTAASIDDSDGLKLKTENDRFLVHENGQKKSETVLRKLSSGSSSSSHHHHKDESNNTHKDKSSCKSSSSKTSGKFSSNSSSSKHRRSEKRESSSSHKSDKKRTSSSSSAHSKDRSHKSNSSSRSSSHHHKSSSSHKSEKEGSGKSSKSSSSNNKSLSNTKTEKHDKKDRSDSKDVKKKREKRNSIEELFDLDEVDSVVKEDDFLVMPEEFQLPTGSDYEDDPDDIALECLKMFEDYKPEEKSVAQTKDKCEKESLSEKFENSLKSNDSSAVGRKRMAHAGADIRPVAIVERPRGQLSGLGLMNQVVKRLESQKQKIEESNVGNSSAAAAATAASNKKRIAHVPNVSGLLRPTNSSGGKTFESLDKGNTKSSENPTSTIAQTAVKGQNRTAHQPRKEVITAKRPIVLLDCPTKSSKVPPVVRQKVLDQMFDSSCKICLDPKNAFQKAILEEDALLKRCSSKGVYQSLAGGRILALRKEAKAEEEKRLDGSGTCMQQPRTANRVVSHQQILDGTASNCSIKKLPRNNAFTTGNELYKALLRYVMTENELQENGFPRPHPSGDAGRVVAINRYGDDNYVSESTRRTCDRCRKVFLVKEDGSQAKEEQCIFHPKRKEKRKVGKDMRSVFPCCGDESGSGSDGCLSLAFHVPKNHPISKYRFVSAVREEGDENEMGTDPWDIVALDCEMIYTTNGNELARATFVGRNDQILYDQIVKPPHPVLDYNTQFSGLTEEDLKNATVTLTDVQAVMLTHVKPNAILIGHSLESDLLALRFKHDCVIDTSVLFPHKMGPPFKRALRNLSSEILRKIIQNSEAGHDSAEDARTALHLVLHQLNEDIKAALKTKQSNGN